MRLTFVFLAASVAACSASAARTSHDGGSLDASAHHDTGSSDDAISSRDAVPADTATHDSAGTDAASSRDAGRADASSGDSATGSVPAAAAAAGFNTNTFDSTTLGNAPGKIYYPAGFNSYGGGTATQNSDGSFTLSDGANNPQVATAQYDTAKSNDWRGECFAGGGYFETTASWKPYAGLGQAGECPAPC
jgi:hypothetical protein